MIRRLVPMLVTMVVMLFGAPGVALAATQDFTVNVTDDHDDGSCDVDDCTLREAIIASNASPDAGTISFDIHGAPLGSVQTIYPITALPDVTAPVTIDGYTEPGASPNTLALSDGDDAVLLMELNGTFSQIIDALRLTGGDITVRGLSINSFLGSGIVIGAGGGGVIEGNFIGTDPSGTLSFGTDNGVEVLGTAGAGNRVGGPSPGARNVISGNGIGVLDDAGATILGNYIGVNAAGDQRLGNFHGVLSSTATVVGEPGAGNVISGQVQFGVIVGPGGVVQGNRIGTNAGMTASLVNVSGGVAATDATVGGTDAGAGNVISGNLFGGIFGQGAVDVVGNWIGTTPTGANLGNGGKGIDLGTGSSGSVVGNVIAFNTGSGIDLAFGTDTEITANSIHDNSGLGIDLGPVGVTPNDPGDADVGANGLQNFPDLSLAARSLGGTAVQGALQSTPFTQFSVDVYSSPTCDDSGNGEGETPLGTFSVTTGASGIALFDQQLAPSTPLGHVLTATATGPEGTSEFSACRTVVKAKTDLVLDMEDEPNIVTAGQNVTYTLTASNNGPNAASGVGVSDPLPGTATMVSAISSQGTCGGTSTVVCDLGTIPKNGTATITIVTRLSTAGSVVNTAVVEGAETDTDLANNSASQTTIVTVNADGCNVVGSSGKDFLVGTAGDDKICGLGGNDTLLGKKGNDEILGGDGNDTIKGAGGNDTLSGDAGDDTVIGGPGFDDLFGSFGADFLKIRDGVHGNDSADGGVDADLDVCKKDSGDAVTNCP